MFQKISRKTALHIFSLSNDDPHGLRLFPRFPPIATLLREFSLLSADCKASFSPPSTDCWATFPRFPSIARRLFRAFRRLLGDFSRAFRELLGDFSRAWYPLYTVFAGVRMSLVCYFGYEYHGIYNYYTFYSLSFFRVG